MVDRPLFESIAMYKYCLCFGTAPSGTAKLVEFGIVIYQEKFGKLDFDV